jgi:hypothetical protein
MEKVDESNSSMITYPNTTTSSYVQMLLNCIQCKAKGLTARDLFYKYSAARTTTLWFRNVWGPSTRYPSRVRKWFHVIEENVGMEFKRWKGQLERGKERETQIKRKRHSAVPTDLMSRVTNKKRTHPRKVTTTNCVNPELDGAASCLQDHISSCGAVVALCSEILNCNLRCDSETPPTVLYGKV